MFWLVLLAYELCIVIIISGHFICAFFDLYYKTFTIIIIIVKLFVEKYLG